MLYNILNYVKSEMRLVFSDAITAGVNPGGLQSRTEIRVLICYILSNSREPLPLESVKERLHFDGIANYFETAYAISDLEESGNITVSENENGKKFYVANKETKSIAEALGTSVPFSVRERSMEIVKEILSRRRNERENKVLIENTESGMYITCSIMDNDFELASIKLLIPDEDTGKAIKENFLKNPVELLAKITETLIETKL